jgi:sugar lactone lactonase YvrE
VLIQAPPDGLSFLGFPVLIGLSSLALDNEGEWLYFAATNSAHLYRIATKDLNDATLSPRELGDRVELFSAKPISSGMAVDAAGNLYVTDVENSAIVGIGRDRQLRTVLKSSLMRWPAGLSFGPDGWLWVTCSSIHEFLFDVTKRHRPYFVIRFRPPQAMAVETADAHDMEPKR